ncbi:MAG TPA: M3 family oligoendopeptidase [Chloroflexota bacterium]
MSTATRLPHWDMTTVYPSLESPEFVNAFRSIVDRIDAVTAFFDERGIDRQDASQVDETSVSSFETATSELAALVEDLNTVYVYVSCFVSTDSRDDTAQARLSELQQHFVRVTLLDTRFTAWIGSLNSDALITRSDVARQLAYIVRRARIEAAHMMSPAEESLSAELNLSAGTAWSKLHGNLSSQLAVNVRTEDGDDTRPMSVVRNMAYDSDREVRRAAYDAEVSTWKDNALPLAAALNSIKGQTNTLARRRGWGTALDVALFENRIDRQTLDTMLAAARESFPDFRRYLRAKAGALGLERLAWYDLFAPVNADTRSWEFEEARDFLLDQFGSYSDRLRRFASRAFEERWIDAEPRPGKRDGAYCVSLRGEESRVLANFRPTYDGMSTLAHELGHGYHNFNLANQPFLLRTAPMTLAETASIFCETIVREAALQRAGREEQISILEASIQSNCQVVVDIVSRFLFEQEVCERRQQRELSVDELNEIMLRSQRQTYGDGLNESVLHPYMWAVKGHYYSVARPFYNFPYMFGLLFGLGLYARYRQDPDEFRRSYDELLSSTGTADVAELTGRFGIDVTTPDFWQASLDIIRHDIERFEQLISRNND